MRNSILLPLLIWGSTAIATTMADQNLAGADIGCLTQGVVPIRQHDGGVEFRVDLSADSYKVKSWTIEPGISGSPILSRVGEKEGLTDLEFDNSGSGCTLRLNKSAIPNATEISIDLPANLTSTRGFYTDPDGKRKKLNCDFTIASYSSLKKACSKAKTEKARIRSPKVVLPEPSTNEASATD